MECRRFSMGFVLFAAYAFSLGVSWAKDDVQVSSRVLSGVIVNDNKHPSVGQLKLRSGVFICSGTLIAEKYFLTADHCVESESASNLTVAFAGVGREVAAIFHHPTVDAAILELANPITTVTPSPLNSTPPTPGTAITIVGYGKRGTGATGPVGDVPDPGTVVEGNNIIQTVTPENIIYSFGIDQSFPAADYGDSGGAVFVEINGVLHIAAIIAEGGVLFGATETDTRVDTILAWINGIINSGGGNGSPPTITEVTASANPVTGTSVVLSVVADDDGGAGSLSYTWGIVPPSAAPVAFDDNGTPTASTVTATFFAASTYIFEVQVLDADGNVTTAQIKVKVSPVDAGSSISPASGTVKVGGQLVFLAGGSDQFGAVLNVIPVASWTVSGGGDIDQRGIFTATTIGGPFTVTAQLSAGGTLTAEVSVVANSIPTVISSTQVSPSTAVTSGVVHFSITVGDADNDALTVTWDFGDGGTGIGVSPSHVYVTAGTYQVTVTITDGLDTVTETLTVAVVDPAGVLFVKRMVAKVRFKVSGRDGLRLIGGFSPGPAAGFSPTGAQVTLDVGGVSSTFVLDSRGRGSNAQGIFMLHPKSTFKTFSVKLKKGTFASQWIDEGITNATVKRSPVSMPIVVTVGGEAYTGTQGLLYTARAGKAGVAR